MVLPSNNIEGFRLVITVLGSSDFFYFPLPENQKELQKIDDFLLTKANNIDYFFEDLNEGLYYEIKSYDEYNQYREKCRNAQGLTIAVKLQNIATDNNPWRCNNCMANNDPNSTKCRICPQVRKYKGGKKKFDF